MNLFQLINGNNYLVINRPLAHAIGLNASIMLSELLDKYEFFKNKNELIKLPRLEGEWFFLTVDCAQERTTLGEKEQRLAIEKLEQFGFITKEIKGLPAKRYFRINEDFIEEFFTGSKNVSRTSQTPNWSLPEAKLAPPKSQRIKEPYLKNPIKEPYESSSSGSKSQEPSKDETLKEKLRRTMKIPCTDQEYEEAVRKLKELPEGHAVVPIKYLKTCIENAREGKQVFETEDDIYKKYHVECMLNDPEYAKRFNEDHNGTSG